MAYSSTCHRARAYTFNALELECCDSNRGHPLRYDFIRHECVFMRTCTHLCTGSTTSKGNTCTRAPRGASRTAGHALERVSANIGGPCMYYSVYVFELGGYTQHQGGITELCRRCAMSPKAATHILHLHLKICFRCIGTPLFGVVT